MRIRGASRLSCFRSVSVVPWLALALLCLASAPLRLFGQPLDWQAAYENGEAALRGGDFARASEALSLAEQLTRSMNPNDPRRARTLVGLARLHRAAGDYAKPEELYRQADPIARDAYGPDSVEYARFLNEVGRYYHTRRKYEPAEQFYMQAFRLRAATLGQEHPEVGESICNLAVLFENQMRYVKARNYYEHALAIRSKALGADNLRTVETHEHFARLLAKLQLSEEAAEHLAKAREIRRPWLNQLVGEAAPSPGAVRPGRGYKVPELLEQSEPVYTEEARIARHEGAVALDVEIDTDGRPRVLGVLRTLGLGLDENAIEAARNWRFRPARDSANRKVAYRATLEINFRLL